MKDGLGATLKEARQRRGLRVKDVAGRTPSQISPSYLSCIENGLRYPSEELLLELAELLGLDPIELYRELVRAKAPASIRDQIFEPRLHSDDGYRSLRAMSLGEVVGQASQALAAQRERQDLLLQLARHEQAANRFDSFDARWEADGERYPVSVERTVLSIELTLDGDATLHRHFLGVTPRPGHAPVVALRHSARLTHRAGHSSDDGFKILEQPEDLAVEVERIALSPERSLLSLLFPNGFRHDPDRARHLSYSFRTKMRGAYTMEHEPHHEMVRAIGENRARSTAMLFAPRPTEEIEIDVHFPRHYVPEEVEAWAGTEEFLETDDNQIERGVCLSWELRNSEDDRVSLRVRRPLVGMRFGIAWKPLDHEQYSEVRRLLELER